MDIDVIIKAQNITPLSNIQNIYSLVERDSEANIIPYCIKNNIGFVSFSPLPININFFFKGEGLNRKFKL